ncbi:MAG TPA: DUF6036 family nucleotidyltransferase [Vicinamibacteria bacterium]|nr:DUF6036 family nucleotidyltransferase [Vicinamibacteria bacterium]
MRGLADAERLRRFLRELARAAEVDAAVYLTGGATAVLFGWRDSTIDADILIVPEHDSLFQALPRLKEELQINVEIASPAHFIPELPGWRERSLFIERIGGLSFYHYDPYAQALAKIERGHAKDLGDVAELLDRGLVEPKRLRELFQGIESSLHRYPAVDPVRFRKRLDDALRTRG